jgi:hypothetical protein
MATANVSTTSPGSTPFSVDVTACNLLTDLTVKDFQVFVGGSLSCQGDSCSAWTKTTATQLTYNGAIIPNGTAIQIRRKTPNIVVQSIVFASRFSSALWNSELDRIIRWREEADLNAVGPGSAVTVATPVDTAYPTGWNGDVSQPPTRNSVFDALQLFAPLASPTFTGVPVAPTAADGTNNTQLATTAFTVTRVANALSSSPALGGNPTAALQAINTDSTRIATTSFVQQELSAYAQGTSTRGNTSLFKGVKNFFINGRFHTWQRGATFPVAAGAGGTSYCADMWRYDLSNGGSGTTAAVSFNRVTHTAGQTAVPNNPRYHLDVVNTTTGVSLPANSYSLLRTYVEGVDVLSGRQVTVSFWAKSTVASKVIGCELVQFFGTGGAPSAEVNGLGAIAFTLTSTWTRYSFTTTLPSISGKTIGSNGYESSNLALNIFLQSGSTFNSRVGGAPINWQGNGTTSFSDAQIELGATATPLDIRDPAAELVSCQRYYEVGLAYLQSYSTASSGTSLSCSFKAVKRVIPTVGVTGFVQVSMTGSPSAGVIRTYGVEVAWTKDATLGQFLWGADFTADASF